MAWPCGRRNRACPPTVLAIGSPPLAVRLAKEDRDRDIGAQRPPLDHQRIINVPAILHAGLIAAEHQPRHARRYPGALCQHAAGERLNHELRGLVAGFVPLHLKIVFGQLRWPIRGLFAIRKFATGDHGVDLRQFLFGQDVEYPQKHSLSPRLRHGVPDLRYGTNGSTARTDRPISKI